MRMLINCSEEISKTKIVRMGFVKREGHDGARSGACYVGEQVWQGLRMGRWSGKLGEWEREGLAVLLFLEKKRRREGEEGRKGGQYICALLFLCFLAFFAGGLEICDAGVCRSVSVSVRRDCNCDCTTVITHHLQPRGRLRRMSPACYRHHTRQGRVIRYLESLQLRGYVDEWFSG